MRHQSHPKAPTKPPQCDPNAPTRLLQSANKAWRWTTDCGLRTTDHLKANAEVRMQNEEWDLQFAANESLLWECFELRVWGGMRDWAA